MKCSRLTINRIRAAMETDDNRFSGRVGSLRRGHSCPQQALCETKE